MHSLPSGAYCGALAFVWLVVCLQELFPSPPGLSLVVQSSLTSYSLHATASPSPKGLVSFPSSPIGLAAVLSTL
jgi:hypothetical protein